MVTVRPVDSCTVICTVSWAGPAAGWHIHGLAHIHLMARTKTQAAAAHAANPGSVWALPLALGSMVALVLALRWVGELRTGSYGSITRDRQFPNAPPPPPPLKVDDAEASWRADEAERLRERAEYVAQENRRAQDDKLEPAWLIVLELLGVFGCAGCIFKCAVGDEFYKRKAKAHGS